MPPVSVLLVDDNTTFLNILKNFLQEHLSGELNVVGTATSGEEALEKASALKPQAVLLDLVMPGLSGVQVIPLMKQVLPQARIIVLTLLDNPDYRRASLAAGADDFVAKEHLDTDLRPVFAKFNPIEIAPPSSDTSPAGGSAALGMSPANDKGILASEAASLQENRGGDHRIVENTRPTSES